MSDVFDGLPRNHFGAILADPPWHFQTYSRGRIGGVNNTNPIPVFTPCRAPDYRTMDAEEIFSLPIKDFASDDSVLFLWICWPNLKVSLEAIEKWGFIYKTCAFSWMKADNRQPHFFQEELKADMKLGYWTRANSEVCLLATRGRPKRLNADVRQGIIAPAREHSRKPDGIHERIERLVAGPYLELFARQKREGWTTWGNELEKFPEVKRDEWSDMWAKPFDKPELL